MNHLIFFLHTVRAMIDIWRTLVYRIKKRGGWARTQILRRYDFINLAKQIAGSMPLSMATMEVDSISLIELLRVAKIKP